MIDTVYIEQAVKQHPQTKKILARFPQATLIPIERYGEVFNPKSQNFRLQKIKPALILAKKHQKFVHLTPEGYGIGRSKNYYFSYMYNCLFDCRYCFLQGLYNSANYLVFVNFEDFQKEITETIQNHANDTITFFSGYDCDSLGFEGYTQFCNQFLPFFESHPQADFELRTKSVTIQSLLKYPALSNVIVAYSLNPSYVVNTYENKTPRLAQRLKAIQKLSSLGWKIGLRFDPLIYIDKWKEHYQSFFKEVFNHISESQIHSVTLGSFRMPKPIYEKMYRLHPENNLFTKKMCQLGKSVGYEISIDQEMKLFCEQIILQHIPKEKYFPCG